MYTLTRLSLRAPAVTFLVVVLVTAAFLAGLPRLRSAFGIRPLLGGEHPAIQTLERFIELYGGGFPVLVVWECGPEEPCRTIFDAASLAMAGELERTLDAVEGVRDVQGPATAPLLVPHSDGFAVRRFVENGRPVSDAEALALRALEDPLWVRHLVSEDGSVGSVVVYLRDSKSDTMERVVDAIQPALVRFEEKGFTFHLVGFPIEAVVAGRDLAESTAALTPFTALIIALIIYALTRSWQAVVITMSTMGVGLLWTFGLLAWLDWPQDSILQVLAPLILIVGVSDAIHVLSRNSVEVGKRGGAPSREARSKAVLAAAQDMGPPCLMTTLTTGAAFLSFLLSDLVTFVHFGLISAFGIGACLVLTFSLLPVLVRWLPASGARAERASGAWNAVLEAVVRTAARRSVPILVATGLLFAVCGVGWVGYLEVDTNLSEMVGLRSRVIRWYRFVDERLRGLDSLEIDVALPERSPIEAPETQEALAAFAEFLESTEGLGPATSVQDLISRLNRVLHDDDPAFERPGASAAANAQLLELVSLDDPDTLSAWLSFDRSHFRISVEGPPDSTRGRGAVLTRVREYVQAKIPADWKVTLTGPFAMHFDWVTAVQSTQFRSFGGAFLLVFVLVALFLGSVRLGLAAMVPALLPAVATLGFMGFAGVSLDVGRVMIAAIVIGIAVDDSVHLLSQYRRRRVRGDTARDAIRSSVFHVGRAVVVTSVALALGFLTLMTSAWETISSFGFFVSVAILVALVAALFVLPAIIFAFRRDGPASSAENHPRSR